MNCLSGEAEAHVQARQHSSCSSVERVGSPVPVLNASSAGVSQHWMSVAWLVPLSAGIAGALARGERVVVPLRGREADAAVTARRSVLTKRTPTLPTTLTLPSFASSPPKRSIRYAASLFSRDVENFRRREALLDVGGAIAQRVPALRRVHVAIRESFGVQVVVAAASRG